jgi:hypothetical protein
MMVEPAHYQVPNPTEPAEYTGSYTTVRHQNVAHCKSVGRDYGSILKTQLGLVVIDNDKEMAEKKVQRILKVIPEEYAREVEDTWIKKS